MTSLSNRFLNALTRFFQRIGLMSSMTSPRQHAFMARYASPVTALNIGAGKTTFREYFPNQVTTDVEERSGMKIDIIADAHDLSVIPDHSYELVLFTEVLEHLHTPQQAIDEIHRVLKPGGLVLLTTRFIFPLHSSPVDYFRYTKYGLRHLLRNFDIVELSDEANTMETLAIIYQRLGFQCKTLWLKPFKLMWFSLAVITRHLGWILTSEYSDGRYSIHETNILTSGYYVAARKR